MTIIRGWVKISINPIPSSTKNSQGGVNAALRASFFARSARKPVLPLRLPMPVLGGTAFFVNPEIVAQRGFRRMAG